MIHKFIDVYVLHTLFPALAKHNVQDYTVSLLAWTTTPWTLPANLALVVNPELRYLQVYDITTNECYILAEELVSKYYKDIAQYIVVYRARGKDLLGLRYTPPYPRYA